MEIALDPMKTPQQNAAAAYKEYKKAVAAEQHLTKLIAEGEAMLDYLESVLDRLAASPSEKEIAEIRRELIAAGVLRAPKGGGKERNDKPLGPMRCVSTAGYEILIGRSNAQNDELTLKTARRTDIWLHVQKCTAPTSSYGPRTRLPGRPHHRGGGVARGILLRGARRAARSPWTTHGPQRKKALRRPPGKVIYTNYETIMAAPDETLAQKLKA